MLPQSPCWARFTSSRSVSIRPGFFRSKLAAASLLEMFEFIAVFPPEPFVGLCNIFSISMTGPRLRGVARRVHPVQAVGVSITCCTGIVEIKQSSAVSLG